MISFSTCSAHSGCRIQVNSIFKHVFRNQIQAFPLHRFSESAELPVNIRTKDFFKLPGKCLCANPVPCLPRKKKDICLSWIDRLRQLRLRSGILLFLAILYLAVEVGNKAPQRESQ